MRPSQSRSNAWRRWPRRRRTVSAERRPARVLLLAAGVLLTAVACGLPWAGPFFGDQGSLRVSRAPEWDALFEEAQTWSGADGGYSIPLAAKNATLFFFGDTIVRNRTRLLFVHNSLARLEGRHPHPGAIRFFWQRETDGTPRAALAPLGSMEWYWPQGGLVWDETVHLFVIRIEPDETGGHFGFRIRGATLLSFPERQRFPPPVVIERPLPVEGPPDGPPDVFGAAVLGPLDDGFVYVYGWRDSSRGKLLLVARTHPARLGDFSVWQYWNGSGWTSEPRGAAPLLDRVSAELGAVRLPDGGVALIYQRDGVGRDTVARVGESPVGRFGPPVVLWSCPETALAPDVYCYNAKTHPALSAPGSLLVSYNVNRSETIDLETLAEIYRPRFLRVPLELLTSPRSTATAP